MKLRKPCYRILSMLLSLILMIGITPITAFAEQGQTAQPQGTVSLPTKEGGQDNEDVSVTVTVTPNGDGTATIEKSTGEDGFQPPSGLNVDYTSKEVVKNDAPSQGNEDSAASGQLISGESHYTVENEDQTYGAEGGSETETGVTDGKNAPNITLGLIEDGEPAGTVNAESGNTNTVTGSISVSTTITVPTHEGDKLKEEDPANYDQTTFTTEGERTATAEIIEITTKTGDPTRTPTEIPGTGEQTDGTQNPAPGSDGYHYFYKDANRTGNMGKYTIEYQWYDGNNQALGSSKTVTGNCVYNLSAEYRNPEDPENNGETIGNLYCMDMSTEAVPGAAYRKVNLEDAAAEGYYSEEEVSRLRAIMNNGYIMNFSFDENGNFTGYSSSAEDLAAFQSKLEAAGEDFGTISWEQAAAATQMAIWTIANREVAPTDDAKTLKIFSNDETVNQLAEYLLSLNDNGLDTGGQKKETQIITKERFIDDLEMVIGDKVSDGATSDTDTYQVGLKFSLVVTPGAKDDLIVKVLDQNGNVVTSAKLPSDDSQIGGAGYAKQVIGNDGKIYYLLDGLSLQENSDVTFSLKLEGFQYLEKGVYVFESKINSNDDGTNTSSSQNLIGMAEGNAVVDVSTTITLSFHVTEGAVTKTREWRREWQEYPLDNHDDDREIPEDEEKEEEGSGGSKDHTEALTYRSVQYVGTAPKTGDSSQTALYTVILLFAISSFCGMIIYRKKSSK